MSVYFITCREVGMVKIGCAADPWDRLAKLRTSSPSDLVLEAVFPGSYGEEKEFHQRFAVHRARLEWFRLAPEIEAFIASSPAPVRGYDGPSRSQRKKLRRLAADNRAVEEKAEHRASLEALVEQSLLREREAFAECMAWRSKHDAPQVSMDLESGK